MPLLDPPPYLFWPGVGFPTIGGRPALITREQFEGCCCQRVFDFTIIRYIWDAAGGADLDTRTAIINVDGSINGVTVGFANQSSVSAGGLDLAPDPYLQWGGDNTDPAGSEAVIVDFTRLHADFPAVTPLDVRLRAHWYGAPVSGDFSIQLATYRGGGLEADGTDFVNVGGILTSEITLARNTLVRAADVPEGVDMGILRYDPIAKTATIV